MIMSATTPSCFIGCDVGKAEIVVFDSATGCTASLPNDDAALTVFASALDAGALVAAGRSVHRADARKVKAFIRSFGILGKTDAIDARALACYGSERHARLARWQPREQQRDQLHLLVTTRRELVRQRTACRNRIQAPAMAHVEPGLRRILAAPLRHAASILRGISGIGPATAAQLIAFMPELGSMGRRQAAALAGLAPHPRQSGNSDGYRRTRGGRTDVKQALFMAGLAAARYNPTLRAFYQRLRNNGKKPIVAIIAVMRKLITIANAQMRDALLN